MTKLTQYPTGKKYPAKKQSLKAIPHEPGVYLFADENDTIVYVGKAKSLKNRLTSYFVTNLEPKTAKMIATAKSVAIITVGSEFEALLLEAKLIKNHLPKYNIQLRDDKSPLYILVTNEEFPRVLTARKTQLAQTKAKHVFGPFLSGPVVRNVLRHLRRVFPFSTHKLAKRVCIYNQIGLCDPCPNEIYLTKNSELKKAYLKNIRNLVGVLNGKSAKVRLELVSEMAKYSARQDFEQAAKIRNKINQLDYIVLGGADTSGYVDNPNLLEDIHEKELAALQEILKNYLEIKSLERIECFDVAHLAGNYPTASMVTFVHAYADKRNYRHFKIHPKLAGDTDRMQEVIARRIKRFADWGKPDLIVVDGGKPQVSVAEKLLHGQVALIGLAKRYETIVVKHGGKFSEIRLKKGPALNLLQRMRDEAHRFSRRLHHKQIAKLFK